MGLLGIRLSDPRFYQLAQEGAEISIDVAKRTVTVGGQVCESRLGLGFIRCQGILGVSNKSLQLSLVYCVVPLGLFLRSLIG